MDEFGLPLCFKPGFAFKAPAVAQETQGLASPAPARDIVAITPRTRNSSPGVCSVASTRMYASDMGDEDKWDRPVNPISRQRKQAALEVREAKATEARKAKAEAKKKPASKKQQQASKEEEGGKAGVSAEAHPGLRSQVAGESQSTSSDVAQAPLSEAKMGAPTREENRRIEIFAYVTLATGRKKKLYIATVTSKANGERFECHAKMIVDIINAESICKNQAIAIRDELASA